MDDRYAMLALVMAVPALRDVVGMLAVLMPVPLIVNTEMDVWLRVALLVLPESFPDDVGFAMLVGEAVEMDDTLAPLHC